MQLHRPIVFFDLETTGTNTATDCTVEIAMLKLHPDGRRVSLTFLINPERPIPAGASRVHGITDAKVRNEPPFAARAGEIAAFFAGCDIGGFNCIGFDIPLLARQMAACGYTFPEKDTQIVDSMTIYHKKNPRDLAAAYQRYCGKELEGAHRAEADITATLEVFLAQTREHSDIAGSLAQVAEFCGGGDWLDLSRKLKRDKDGDVTFGFGKHIGKKVKSELDYAVWMLGADFPEDTKGVLRELGIKN